MFSPNISKNKILILFIKIFSYKLIKHKIQIIRKRGNCIKKYKISI